MFAKFRRLVMLVCVALLGSLAVAQETADTSERNSGPKNLVITYRCIPAKRPALRQYPIDQRPAALGQQIEHDERRRPLARETLHAAGGRMDTLQQIIE